MARERAAHGMTLARALLALALLVPASSRPADDAPGVRAPLDLEVNGGRRAPIHAFLRGEDAWVAVEDLEAAGLRNLGGTRQVIDGRAYVSLASLAPGLRHELDERELALRVFARGDLLGRLAVDLGASRRPPGLELADDASGFVNYSLQLRSDGGTSGFLEAGASRSGRLVASSGQLLADGTAVRGLTTATFDDPRALRRLVVGDAFASGTGLGGGVLLAGVSLAREYGLDPYFVRSPMPGLSGFAATPSVLDVYVNGVLAREVPVPPGGYDVSNLPVTAGAGDVRAVLRDAFGRTEEVVAWSYYYTPTLLAPGLSDFGYAAGFRRLEYGRESFEYGAPVLLARHRAGVREGLTLGGRLEAALDLLSGGPSVTLGLGFGTLDLEAAASVGGGRAGAAASVAYAFVSRRLSGGARARALTGEYAHASLRPADDRARLEAGLFANARLTSRVTAGASYTAAERRDAGFSDALSARTDLLVARGLTLGVTGSRRRAPDRPPVHDALATLSWAFAPSSVADLAVQRDGRTAAGVQRGLPAGTGLGFRARADSGRGGESATTSLQYQWDHGRYEVQYDAHAAEGAPATRLGTATIAGGAVFLGDRVFLSRPVQDGFALIRVGVPGVRGFAEGREIGRTDGRGDLLVPSLLPYYGNRLGIADRDVPVEYGIGATERLAAPALRGGVVSRFAVRLVRAVEGELVAPAPGGDAPPAYGELTVVTAAGPRSSPVGRAGRFFLEDVSPGAHVGEVRWSGGVCRAVLVVPEAPARVELGRVRCEPAGGESVERVEPPAAAPEDPEADAPQAAEPSARATEPASQAPEARTAASASPVARAGAGGAASAAPDRPRRQRERRTGPAAQSGGQRRPCPECVLAAIARAFEGDGAPPLVSSAAAPYVDEADATEICLAAAGPEERCAECLLLRQDAAARLPRR